MKSARFVVVFFFQILMIVIEALVKTKEHVLTV